MYLRAYIRFRKNRLKKKKGAGRKGAVLRPCREDALGPKVSVPRRKIGEFKF